MVSCVVADLKFCRRTDFDFRNDRSALGAHRPPFRACRAGSPTPPVWLLMLVVPSVRLDMHAPRAPRRRSRARRGVLARRQVCRVMSARGRASKDTTARRAAQATLPESAVSTAALKHPSPLHAMRRCEPEGEPVACFVFRTFLSHLLCVVCLPQLRGGSTPTLGAPVWPRARLAPSDNGARQEPPRRTIARLVDSGTPRPKRALHVPGLARLAIIVWRAARPVRLAFVVSALVCVQTRSDRVSEGLSMALGT